MEQPQFASVEDYGTRFTDTAYWSPYVEAVCIRHNIMPCCTMQTGLPGTFPVFLVDDRYVVKFFGDLFQGAQRFAVELDCYSLLSALPQIPTPTLLAHGSLFPDSLAWQWPYLVSSLIPGTSLGSVREQVFYDDKLAIFQTLGPLVRDLHSVALGPAHFLAPTWDRFLRFLQDRRAACISDHRRWGVMPDNLIEQIDVYLPPLETLIDRHLSPRLLHCDLNEDHVLGAWEEKHWRLTGIIDFGDAMVGDWIYELIALHVGLAHCDKRLLGTFLDAYGWNQGEHEQFVQRAMSYTLLHEFAVLRQVFEEFPSAREVETLAELATWLWDPTYPGFR